MNKRMTRPASALSLALLLTACGGDIGEPTTVEVDEGAEVAATDAELAPGSDIAPLDDVTPPDALQPREVEPVADAASADMALQEGWNALRSDWAAAVPEVQARFGELSEEEVLAIGGDREQLVLMVQEKYSLDPEEAERQVSDFEATL